MNPSAPPAIKVALVEDEAQIRESLAILIEGAPGFRCVGRYADAESALASLPGIKPDVVLMDIRLPRLSGVECARQLKRLLPAAQIVMLTVFEDDAQVFDSLTAGASGYLIKRTPPAQILEAIAEVQRGGSPMSSAIARKVVQYVQTVARPPASEFAVSVREQEILDRLARGFRYKEIADALGISLDTVRSHIRRIYEKLHVHSRTEAVVKYLHR